jgi:hypothetical protein
MNGVEFPTAMTTDNKHWERFEKIVCILERQIQRGAVVKRNQFLPVLGSPSGRTRQCDVVIEEGAEPRVTRSIVEVQKRAAKPTINDFNGWVEKLREVGAQHLICVSAKGFTRSIREKADLLGPTVRLITLKDTDDAPWPIPRMHLHDKMQIVKYEKLNGYQMEGHHLMRIDPNENPVRYPNPHEKIFKLPDDRLLSPTDFLDWHFFSTPKNLEELPKGTLVTVGAVFNWDRDDAVRFQDFGGTWVPLKWVTLYISLSVSETEIEWEGSAYEQTGWGEIGWVLRGHATFEGRSVDLIAPLVRVASGEYYLRSPVVIGDFDAFFSFQGQSHKASRFSDVLAPASQ